MPWWPKFWSTLIKFTGLQFEKFLFSKYQNFLFLKLVFKLCVSLFLRICLSYLKIFFLPYLWIHREKEYLPRYIFGTENGNLRKTRRQ